MPGRPNRSDSYAYGVTLLLMLAYALNSADRTLIAIIGQPLKADLGLSDTELGLLVGTAFAALYAFSGIPIARLAERFNRVNILFVVMVLWSGLTALCGTAMTFTQLLLLRMGVGLGEAGCSPPAHSLLGDYFAPQRRATAISIYSCGISLGYILSAMVGGYVALHYGWRTACVAVGLPGVVVAFLVKLIIKEPPRGSSEARPYGDDGLEADAAEYSLVADVETDTTVAKPIARTKTGTHMQDAATDVARQPSRFRQELAQLVLVIRILLLRWPIANFVLGVTIATFASQGSWAFIPAFFNRAFGLDYATVGLIAGFTGGVAVGFGLVAGGFSADFLGRRSARWYALVPAIGLLTAAPIYVIAFLQRDWKTAAFLLGVAGFFQYLSFGPTFGVVQNVVGPRQRASATALIYVVLNVISLGGGAVFTGWLIDRFAEINFGHSAAQMFGNFSEVMSASTGRPSFHVACPGGQAMSNAFAGARALCQSTLSLSSREGIIATVLLYGWAAIHYLLGGIGLEGELRAARLRNADSLVNAC